MCIFREDNFTVLGWFELRGPFLQRQQLKNSRRHWMIMVLSWRPKLVSRPTDVPWWRKWEPCLASSINFAMRMASTLQVRYFTWLGTFQKCLSFVNKVLRRVISYLESLFQSVMSYIRRKTRVRLMIQLSLTRRMTMTVNSLSGLKMRIALMSRTLLSLALQR